MITHLEQGCGLLGACAEVGRQRRGPVQVGLGCAGVVAVAIVAAPQTLAKCGSEVPIVRLCATRGTDTAPSLPL